MAEGVVSLVLRCELCNKPFDKQSTLKRHGYYCRSRRIGSTNRLRSCIPCAKGKARCDNKRPDCSRCLAKSFTCQYPATRPSTRTTRTDPSLSEAHDTSVDALPENTSAGDVILEDSFAADIENFNWEQDSNINFAEFLQSPLIGGGMSDIIPDSEESLLLTPSSNPTLYVPPNGISLTHFVIPPTPTDAHRRSLDLRSNPATRSHRTVTLILHTLKSYPQMMLRDNVLPPFIHPHLASPNFSSNNMESLNNCISLVRMISHEVKGSRSLFWKIVRTECERLVTEATKLNEWELLSGMHSLSIYILLRLSEGETEHNNFDILLLTTMTALARQLALSDITYTPKAHTCDAKACWEEWIYMESRRRLSVIFRIINMLVYFDVGSMCSLQSGLVLAPLPAKKQLWEAPDEIAWKAERDKQPTPRTAFGLTTSGELVRLDEMDLYGGYGEIKPMQGGNKTSEQNWEEWCAGIDTFGGLVMFAASLIG